MEIKKGIGVSPGVVISTAVVLDAEDLLIPERHVAAGDAAEEAARFHKAVEDSVAELVVIRESTAAQAGKEIAGIFDVHIGMLRDRNTILKDVEAEIGKQH